MMDVDEFNPTQLLQLEDFIKKFYEIENPNAYMEVQEIYKKELQYRLNQELFLPLMTDVMMANLSKKINGVSKLNNSFIKSATSLGEDLGLLFPKFETDIDFSEASKNVKIMEAIMDLLRMVKEETYNQYFSYGLNETSDTNCSKDTNPLVTKICSIEPNFAVTLNFDLVYSETTKKSLTDRIVDFWNRIYGDLFLHSDVYYTIEDGDCVVQVHCAVQLPEDMPGRDEIVERRKYELEIQNYLKYLFVNRYGRDVEVFLSKIQNPVAWAEYMTKGVKDASELYLIKPKY